MQLTRRGERETVNCKKSENLSIGKLTNCKHSDEVYISEDCDCLFCPAGKRDRGIELHTVE